MCTYIADRGRIEGDWSQQNTNRSCGSSKATLWRHFFLFGSFNLWRLFLREHRKVCLRSGLVPKCFCVFLILLLNFGQISVEHKCKTRLSLNGQAKQKFGGIRSWQMFSKDSTSFTSSRAFWVRRVFTPMLLSRSRILKNYKLPECSPSSPGGS